ncbi:uncharacterized protein LOC119840090 [Zerene cesonia]|uniref:uncharacterized protein LOC119840090 n=1 Tax=Zerene cesonia TaxID=33412 RepID=UPI0018E4E061|nr:uncharacterized protein LOC119840090 [Zerene cesonia]
MARLSQLTAVIAVVISISSSSIVTSPNKKDGTFELLILHNNDMHAHFEQSSQLSGACTTADRDAGKCYGGFPRVAHVVKEARKAAASGEGPPVLYLNAGDTYTGTAWFTIYKWKIAAEFLNALQPDAVSLGNNEFDEENKSISHFLQNLDSIIIATNVIVNVPEAQNKIKKSSIINIDGTLVGIVGYLTPESSVLDSEGKIEYIDEVLALTEEVTKLKKENVKIIIALGYSTSKNIEIAQEVDGIDLIIVGNQNKYLTNGTVLNDGIEDTENLRIVLQSSGKRVPIIKSYAYSKYLGKINLAFDNHGELFHFNVDYLLLDNSIPQDYEALRMTNNVEKDLAFNSMILGQTAVVLDGTSCKSEECNLANLLTDAIIQYYASRFEGERWTDAPIAIIHGGALTGRIAPEKRPGDITRSDLYSVITSSSNLVAVTMNGKILNEALEHSVYSYTTAGSEGFLQFSGVRVTYDFNKDPGSRIINAVARCWNCAIPEFYEIEDNRDYKVIMPSSLANGELGYSMFTNLPRVNLNYDEFTCVTEFMSTRSPVYPEIADRINLLNTDTSLGNHEFDNGIAGLLPFIANLTCPNLAANLVLDEEPELMAEPKLRNSVVFDVNGVKVGVVGYLTPDTQFLAVRNKVKYISEVTAIKNEVKKLQSEGVKILIALGHSGFTKDLEIAKEVDGIDLVIGGHTNTFLWNGPPPDSEVPIGPYPKIVKQNSGRNVPVVQAYAYTKYLGYLRLIFNSEGEIINIRDTNPVLLNNNIPQDPEVLSIVNKYRGEVMKVSEVIVGSTLVFLDGQTCRLRECNMGNLITDAIVRKYASEYTGVGWTDTPIAVLQGGGIRASINNINKISNITIGDLLTVMPFDDRVVKVTMNGSDIRKMLEHSVSQYNLIRAPGQFLQVSGMRVEYDLKKKPGQRLLKALTLCGNCKIPIFAPLNDSASYNILINGFLSMGGDGYISLGNHEFDHGVSGLTPFIENLTSPVLAANLVLTKVPELEAESNLRKSIVFNISGTPIGVIGYLTPETKKLAVKNNVEYIDEIIALKKEVENLKNEGVNIIIALGHSGYLKDIEIAKTVDGLNLVIGGHTNTFLWNGTSPDSEKIIGPYPTYVTQASGKQVPVVQAYAYTKYLGKLHMVFNNNGELLSADGNPILLDNSIPQDPEVLEIINRYRKKVLNLTEEVIGTTLVVLDGHSCQHKECNLGNLIADAMIYKYVTEYRGEYWSDTPVAIIQGGGIRSAIAVREIPTAITKGDLIAVLPFEGVLVVVTMNGTILMKMLEHSSLGNHEFDEAVDGVIPFIRNLTSPVLAANLILDEEPDLKAETNLYKSIILSKNNVKIGIIGYLTPETKFLAPRNKVNYEDEIPAVRREVQKLKQNDVNIIIALGHSGFIKDLEIASEVEDIDIVIGGHSNTFLSNVNTTEIPEFPQGPYPTIVMQKSGRKVLVVQAYAYTKYMGSLYLTFNENGDIINYEGNPILLNNAIPQDPDVLNIVKKYHSEIDRINNVVVGSSFTYLDGESCRLYECNLGNFLCDVMINYTKHYHAEFSQVNIALIQGGRIRTSIDQPKKPFNLTRGDWITVIPFSDTLCIVHMNGSVLMKALEHSVDSWRKIDATGQFLQMSGVEVMYDLNKLPGSRVIQAKAICSDCNRFTNIEDNLQYQIIMSEFLADGGDGYFMFEGLEKEIVSYNEVSCALDYLSKFSPINPKVSGRIKLLNEDKIINIPGFIDVNIGSPNTLLPSGTEKRRLDLVLVITIILCIVSS